MQESLFNTVQKLKNEEKVNVEELETILNSNIEEVVTLCKKACLKPKTDKMGNAYFTKEDVTLLKKIKELYTQTQNYNKTKKATSAPKQVSSQIEMAQEEDKLVNPSNKIELLAKAKERMRKEVLMSSSHNSLAQFQDRLDNFENNLIEKISTVLSEKMDGFDEIIVELIRAKTENENLRQQVNTLNKQNYILKTEVASYTHVALGLYTKRETNADI